MSNTNRNKKHSGAGAKLPYTIRKQDWKFLPEHYEKANPETKTVPDEAVSIQELLKRHAQGITGGEYRQGYYHDTEDYDAEDMEKLVQADLLEIHEAQLNASAIIADAEKQKQANSEAKKPEQKQEDNSENKEQNDQTNSDQNTE